MSAEAKIAGILISYIPENVQKPMGGQPMVELQSAELVEGSGIRSTDGLKDRYFIENGQPGKGAWSKVRPGVRQLSIITEDAIVRANNERDIPFIWADTRRNIIVSDMAAEELNGYLEKEMELGEVSVKGLELCDPCDRPDKLSGKSGFKSAFTNRSGVSIGGIRVQIQSSGTIYIDDPVSGR